MNPCVCDIYLYILDFILVLAQIFCGLSLFTPSQGWFPAAYVVPIEDFSNTIATR